MAITSSKVLIASIFVSLLVLQGVQAIIQPNHVTSSVVVSEPSDSSKIVNVLDLVITYINQYLFCVCIDCKGACAERCKLSGRPNLCKRACGTCCAKCNCVPPGTYGNYEACPCYASLTTRNNKPKCP
ncbi:PREDICTED: snakin-2-like [Erythranthe guttata]|uniref:snakin-2-like n=1 Tax=Erythranthe guttata TaxID=4155 RepID=UPI00064E0529|nr:PREDICTED: snakin-2-like [Erythranthe guttata]|eukprot:XP_012836758.1 PREDICTED: snakin-2-like [Erythranthe guttata]